MARVHVAFARIVALRRLVCQGTGYYPSRKHVRLGCRLLWSEDLRNGAVYDGVEVRNPFTRPESVQEPGEEYGSGAKSARRFRVKAGSKE